MSKYGVGIGEDFPLDDGQNAGDGGAPRDEREEFEEWKRRRDARRAEREEWQRRRAEWKARKRAFKNKVRDAARESFGPEWERYRRERWHDGRFPYWPVWMLVPLFGLLLLIALVSAVASSPFLFLALAALGIFFIAHRRHHHHHRYDFDMQPANGPIVTPPPSSTSAQPPAPPPPSMPPSGK